MSVSLPKNALPKPKKRTDETEGPVSAFSDSSEDGQDQDGDEAGGRIRSRRRPSMSPIVNTLRRSSNTLKSMIKGKSRATNEEETERRGSLSSDNTSPPKQSPASKKKVRFNLGEPEALGPNSRGIAVDRIFEGGVQFHRASNVSATPRNFSRPYRQEAPLTSPSNPDDRSTDLLSGSPATAGELEAQDANTVAPPTGSRLSPEKGSSRSIKPRISQSFLNAKAATLRLDSIVEQWEEDVQEDQDSVAPCLTNIAPDNSNRPGNLGQLSASVDDRKLLKCVSQSSLRTKHKRSSHLLAQSSASTASSQPSTADMKNLAVEHAFSSTEQISNASASSDLFGKDSNEASTDPDDLASVLDLKPDDPFLSLLAPRPSPLPQGFRPVASTAGPSRPSHNMMNYSDREYSVQVLGYYGLRPDVPSSLDNLSRIGNYGRKLRTFALNAHNERWGASVNFYKPFEVGQWVAQYCEMFFRVSCDLSIKHYQKENFDNAAGHDKPLLQKTRSLPDLRTAWEISKPCNAVMHYAELSLAHSFEKFPYLEKTLSGKQLKKKLRKARVGPFGESLGMEACSLPETPYLTATIPSGSFDNLEALEEQLDKVLETDKVISEGQEDAGKEDGSDKDDVVESIDREYLSPVAVRSPNCEDAEINRAITPVTAEDHRRHARGSPLWRRTTVPTWIENQGPTSMNQVFQQDGSILTSNNQRAPANATNLPEGLSIDIVRRLENLDHLFEDDGIGRRQAIVRCEAEAREIPIAASMPHGPARDAVQRLEALDHLFEDFDEESEGQSAPPRLRGGELKKKPVRKAISNLFSRSKKLVTTWKAKHAEGKAVTTEETILGDETKDDDGVDESCYADRFLDLQIPKLEPLRLTQYFNSMTTTKSSEYSQLSHQPRPNAIIFSHGSIVPTSSDGYAMAKRCSENYSQAPRIDSSHGDIRRIAPLNLNKTLPTLPTIEETSEGRVPNSRAWIEDAFKVSAELEHRRRQDSPVKKQSGSSSTENATAESAAIEAKIAGLEKRISQLEMV